MNINFDPIWEDSDHLWRDLVEMDLPGGVPGAGEATDNLSCLLRLRIWKK